MDELISRKATIDAIHKSTEKYNYFMGMENYTDEDAIEAINTVPASQVISDAEWIPVTERLPEDSERVLITHRGGVSFGWYNGRYWERGASTNHRMIRTVTAWMPLPEPYRGE